MTSVSLKDLKAKRAAMTRGEWAADRVLGLPRDDDPILANVITLDLDSDGRQQQIADCYDNTRCPDKQCEANATGIVATHNAADVLIEIAEAALARQQAEMYLQEVRLAWQANKNYDVLRAARVKRDAADIRWREALAKVQP